MNTEVNLNIDKALSLKPTLIMWATALFIFVTTSVALYVSMQQPWMGITFSEEKTTTIGLEVIGIGKNSPADGKLRIGDKVIAIQGNTQPVIITQELLIDPTTLPTLNQYNHFFEQQQTAYEVLKQDKVTLILADGNRREIEPRATRPLSATPPVYWIYVATDFIGLLCGVLIWSYRPNYLPAIALFYMGASYYIGMLMAIMMMRELALEGSWVKTMITLFAFCTHTFIWTFISLMALTPKRLFSNKILLVTGVIILGSWLNMVFAWRDLPVQTFFLIFLLCFIFIFYILFVQWKHSRSDPVNRASLLIYILTFTFYMVAICGLWMVPMSFGLPTILDIKSILTIIPLSLIGFTIAAAQFNLFEVEKWWFKTWFWLLSGISIILMDLLLIFFLDFNKTTALGTSLLIAGFIYFPLRQWLFTKITPIKDQPLELYLPQFVSSVSTHVSAKGLDQSWLQVLKDRFEPMNADWNNNSTTIKIRDHGFTLCVPDIENTGHYQLSGKHLGNKLFNKNVASLVENLLKLMRLIEHTSDTKHKLVQAERKRVMQDMHDTVGSSLLSLSQRLNDPADIDHIHATQQTLRDSIHLSTSETPLWIQDVMADIRIEVVERCELAKVTLAWEANRLPKQQTLSITQSITLINIFREAISNAIRHASPSKIGVMLSYTDKNLCIVIKNNGDFLDREEWKYGWGLDNMRSRTIKLGGVFSIVVKKGCVETKVELPLEIK